MLRSILLGLDSSASGIAAQELGVQWSQQLGCRLVGITIVDGPVFPVHQDQASGEALGRGVGSVAAVEPGLKVASGLREVEEEFGRLCRDAGVEHRVVEEVGSPHVQILLEAQKHDMILLGQRSSFEFGWEGTPGETLGKVLQDSPRPVVFVPETLRTGTSIAVAYDGSLEAARGLASFVATGVCGGRPVHIIAVTSHADRAQAAQSAERAIAFLRNHDIHATSHLVEAAREPADVILKTAEGQGAGLLVMGVYGQSALRQLILGSVTRTVLKESTIPVFCCR
jgi:nucleotide-binding universal stress UspA family protein